MPDRAAKPALADSAPTEEQLTDYDRAYLSAYARLLDADEAGASWEEAARIVLGLDVEKDRDRAKRIHESHLVRARWISDKGYRTLLG